MNKLKMILFICIFLANSPFAFGESNQIYPPPKEILYKNRSIIIDNSWHIICNTDDNRIYDIAEKLQEYFKDQMKLKLKIANPSVARKDKVIVFINLLHESIDTHPFKLNLSQNINIKEEGYIIESDEKRVIIAANNEAGLFYGMQTLKDLTRKEGGQLVIDSVSIKDWPDFKIRGIHMLAADYKHDAYKQLELLARHKYNMVIFEHWDIYNLNDECTRKAFDDLFSYCRNLYIKPAVDIGVPMPVFIKDPHAASGVYIEDELFIFKENKAESVNNRDIYIENSDFEIIADRFTPEKWNMGEGWRVDASISHAEGRSSMLVNVDNNRGSECLEYGNKIEVEANTWYGLRFYAKTSFGEGPFAPAVRVLEYNRWGMSLTRELHHIQHIFELNKPNREFWQERWHKAELVFKTHPHCAKIVICADVYKSTAKAWFDDFRLMRLNAALTNIVRTDSIDVKVYSTDKTEIYEEGKDYTLSEGQIEFLDSEYCYYDFESEPSIIKRLPGGAIDENQKVFISYNAAFKVEAGSASGIPYCISEPRTYQGSEDNIWQGIYAVIDEAAVNLKPDYIHYSHASEMKGLNRDGRDLKRGMDNYELVAEDINKIYNYIKKKGYNIDILVWDDMLNPWHNGGNVNYQVPYGGAAGATSQAVDLISKDVLIVIWWYDLKDSLGKMQNSPNFFTDKGFKYIVAGYDNLENIEKWSKLAKNKESCEGIIITTWEGFNKNRDVIIAASNYLW